MGGDNLYFYAPNPTFWIDPSGLLRCRKKILERDVYQDDSIFDGGKPDLEKIDWEALNSPSFDKLKSLLNAGKTNKELMELGYAPFGYDGKQVNLHHVIGKEPGPMAELAGSIHQKYHKPLHAIIEDGRSFRNNPKLLRKYNRYKKKYWKERAKDFC